MTGANIDRYQYWLASKITKKIATINSGPSIYVEFQITSKLKLLQLLWPKRWQMSNLTAIKNHKKLLSLLNSPPSICVEYEISSKLKHLLFFLQNYGLKDYRCQHWQVSILTCVNNYKNLLSPLNSPPSICAEYKISSKLKHLLFFVQNYDLKDDRCQRWQESTLSRITENYCHQWIQQLQIVHYAKFCGKWLTSFPAPHSPFPFLKMATNYKPYSTKKRGMGSGEWG